VLVWLDKEGAYAGFADRLRDRGVTEAFPIPVRCLRGSYLELMLALEELEDGVAMTPLVCMCPVTPRTASPRRRCSGIVRAPLARTSALAVT
jgi:hypothetical protein